MKQQSQQSADEQARLKSTIKQLQDEIKSLNEQIKTLKANAGD